MTTFRPHSSDTHFVLFPQSYHSLWAGNFSIRLSVRTSGMCILLVRTTKLLAQKIQHDNTGSEKFFCTISFLQCGHPIGQVGSYFSLSEWKSYLSWTFGQPKFPALSLSSCSFSQQHALQFSCFPVVMGFPLLLLHFRTL